MSDDAVYDEEFVPVDPDEAHIDDVYQAILDHGTRLLQYLEPVVCCGGVVQPITMPARMRNTFEAAVELINQPDWQVTVPEPWFSELSRRYGGGIHIVPATARTFDDYLREKLANGNPIG